MSSFEIPGEAVVVVTPEADQILDRGLVKQLIDRASWNAVRDCKGERYSETRSRVAVSNDAGGYTPAEISVRIDHVLNLIQVNLCDSSGVPPHKFVKRYTLSDEQWAAMSSYIGGNLRE